MGPRSRAREAAGGSPALRGRRPPPPGARARGRGRASSSASGRSTARCPARRARRRGQAEGAGELERPRRATRAPATRARGRPNGPWSTGPLNDRIDDLRSRRTVSAVRVEVRAPERLERVGRRRGRAPRVSVPRAGPAGAGAERGPRPRARAAGRGVCGAGDLAPPPARSAPAAERLGSVPAPPRPPVPRGGRPVGRRSGPRAEPQQRESVREPRSPSVVPAPAASAKAPHVDEADDVVRAEERRILRSDVRLRRRASSCWRIRRPRGTRRPGRPRERAGPPPRRPGRRSGHRSPALHGWGRRRTKRRRGVENPALVPEHHRRPRRDAGRLARALDQGLHGIVGRSRNLYFASSGAGKEHGRLEGRRRSGMAVLGRVREELRVDASQSSRKVCLTTGRFKNTL